MIFNVTIRPASPQDAQVGSRLVHIAMGPLADFLLGLSKPARARLILARVFSAKGNRFSYQHSDIAEKDNQAAGLLLSYPGRLMKRLAARMAWQLLRVYGLIDMLRFLGRALPLVRVKEAGPDEYFIHAIAVLPEFQGQGIGTRLLAHAEHKARAQGFRKCSLSVEIGNDRARALYERTGYRVVETIEVAQLSRLIGFKGLHRMVKALDY